MEVSEYYLRKDRKRCRYSGKTARSAGAHTWRWSGGADKNPCLNGTRAVTTCENVSIIPVTAIDSLLSDFNSSDQPLRRREAWDDVPAALLENCLGNINSYDRFHRRGEQVFDLPVIGHLIVSANSKQDAGASYNLPFLQWGGATYDPKKLYFRKEQNKVKLFEFGPVFLDEPAFSDPHIKPLSCRITDLHHHRVYGYNMCHCSANMAFDGRCNSTYDAPVAGSKPGVIIDLLVPQIVSHIGITAQMPRVRIFPERNEDGRRRITTAPTRQRPRYGRLRHKPPADDPFVYVVEEAERLGWVTSYELFFRRLDTGKWEHLGTCAGNSDGASERVTPLRERVHAADGLHARFLKLVPTAHHVRPSFRVAVYGRDLRAERRRAGAAGHDAAETVRYTLTAAGPAAAGGGRWGHDGCYWNWKCRGWFGGGGERFAGPRSEIRDQIACGGCDWAAAAAVAEDSEEDVADAMDVDAAADAGWGCTELEIIGDPGLVNGDGCCGGGILLAVTSEPVADSESPGKLNCTWPMSELDFTFNLKLSVDSDRSASGQGASPAASEPGSALSDAWSEVALLRLGDEAADRTDSDEWQSIGSASALASANCDSDWEISSVGHDEAADV